jgi:endonuclease-3
VVTPDFVTSNQRIKPESYGSLAVALATEAKTATFSSRPTPKECLYVTQELAKLHPDVLKRNNKRRAETLGACGLQRTVLDGVVSTILSQNTTSANSTRAFAQLKRTFSTWEQVEALPNPSKLEEAIRSAGLAKTKAERIYSILKTVRCERGSVSLEYLRDYSDDDVKDELNRFKGIGPKTVACVMLFTMNRAEFPVDTHVLRISQQMGWVGPSTSREDAYQHLNALVPTELKLDLHCLLIAHGKQCHRCAARGRPQFPPSDGSRLVCPLVNMKKNGSVMNDIAIKVRVLVKQED